VQKINTKVSGYVEKLYINATGEAVERGQPILSIYSPELLSTQAEYLLALRGEEALHHSPFPEAVNSSKALLDAARRRLLLWDIPAAEVKRLEESGKPQKALTLRSPMKGYVTAKDVFEGSYVAAGSDLYTVTDLSRVWVLLDVYEREMPFVRVGMPVTLRLVAYPGEPINGAVTYVYPYLDEKTRTNKVRVELDNPKLRLKPDMYATAEMSASLGDRLAVPSDAVIDSGTEQVVFVAAGDGRFEPRTVRLGERGDGYVEVLDGVREGEQVVVSANFMVDSESRLKAAMDAAGGTHQH
jgi:Cu(I)/Ag(I) efflux system membrane fusion protein